MEEGHSEVDPQDENGRTPLHMAAIFGRTDTAEILIQHGADINIPDNENKTPMMIAQENGLFDFVQRLNIQR